MMRVGFVPSNVNPMLLMFGEAKDRWDGPWLGGMNGLAGGFVSLPAGGFVSLAVALCRGRSVILCHARSNEHAREGWPGGRS
jgi:hypothetical protein